MGSKLYRLVELLIKTLIYRVYWGLNQSKPPLIFERLKVNWDSNRKQFFPKMVAGDLYWHEKSENKR